MSQGLHGGGSLVPGLGNAKGQGLRGQYFTLTEDPFFCEKDSAFYPPFWGLISKNNTFIVKLLFFIDLAPPRRVSNVPQYLLWERDGELLDGGSVMPNHRARRQTGAVCVCPAHTPKR